MPKSNYLTPGKPKVPGAAQGSISLQGGSGTGSTVGTMAPLSSGSMISSGLGAMMAPSVLQRPQQFGGGGSTGPRLQSASGFTSGPSQIGTGGGAGAGALGLLGAGGIPSYESIMAELTALYPNLFGASGANIALGLGQMANGQA